jgi:hypothetical protein
MHGPGQAPTRRWKCYLDWGTQSIVQPVVVDGIVYCASGEYLYAFNANDGSQIWRRYPVQGSIIVGLAVHHGVAYLETGGSLIHAADGVAAVRLWDGAVLWTTYRGAFQGGFGLREESPVILDVPSQVSPLVFVRSANGQFLYAIAPDYDTSQPPHSGVHHGDQIWEYYFPAYGFPLTAPAHAPVAVSGDPLSSPDAVLYVGASGTGHTGYVPALGWRIGQQPVRIFNSDATYDLSPIADLAVSQGTVYLLTNTPAGSPSIPQVLAFDAATLSLNWSANWGVQDSNNFGANPSLLAANGNVYASNVYASTDSTCGVVSGPCSTIVSLDAFSGTQRWKSQVPVEVVSMAGVVGGEVVLRERDTHARDTIAGLNDATGAIGPGWDPASVPEGDLPDLAGAPVATDLTIGVPVLNLPTPSQSPPQLTVSPDGNSLINCNGAQPNYPAVTVRNYGGGTLRWQVNASNPSVTVSPSGGWLNEGESQTLTLDNPVGDGSTDLTFTSDASQGYLSIGFKCSGG